MELGFRTGNPGVLLDSRLTSQLGGMDRRTRQLEPRITAGRLQAGRQAIPPIGAAVMTPDFVGGA